MMVATSLTLTPPDPAWASRGICRNNPGLMEAEDTASARRAKNVCRVCPVWQQCRAWVLSLPRHADVDGVAGGLTARERTEIRNRPAEGEPDKICRSCRRTLPASAFYLRPRERGGREARCNDCRRRQNRDYKAAKRAKEAMAS